MFIDTHAHLNFRDYQRDLDQVINRAVKNGVEKIICVSSNLADSERAVKLAQKYPGIVYAAIGIHPHTTDGINYHKSIHRNQAIKRLEKLAKEPEVVAFGECGLDYYQIKRENIKRKNDIEIEKVKTKQKKLFKMQLEIAKESNLPVIIHSRDAHQDVIQMIERIAASVERLAGVFHCYSAGKKGIQPVLDLGFYFGFDGNLTYDEGLQNVAREIPLEKILLETDSPYLSPEPFRGERNEPKNVKIITECLAKLKGVSFEEVCQITSQNARKLFRI